MGKKNERDDTKEHELHYVGTLGLTSLLTSLRWAPVLLGHRAMMPMNKIFYKDVISFWAEHLHQYGAIFSLQNARSTAKCLIQFAIPPLSFFPSIPPLSLSPRKRTKNRRAGVILPLLPINGTVIESTDPLSEVGRD